MQRLTLRLLFLVIAPLLYFFVSSAFVYLLIFNFFPLTRNSLTTERRMIKAPVYTLFSKQPPVLGAYTSSINSSDARPALIEQFFAKYKSPLSGYGEEFVQAADKYGLPWELLPAITMQESNGGKKLPKEDCLNPFGWGVHSKSTLCFPTWEESIEKVAAGLKKHYVDQGLNTTNEIMSKYNPTSFKRDGSWGSGVEYFVEELRGFITL